MKIYINDYTISHMPVTVYIDNVVVKEETFYDGYVYKEKAVDVPKLKNVIKALEMLGSKVKRITIDCHFTDLDNKYYHRFPEDVTDKLWSYLNWSGNRELEVNIKGDRLYTTINEYTIVLPKRMYTDYDDETLRVILYVE